MKKQFYSFLALWLCLSFVQNGWAQCTSMPTDASALAACNFEIALRFAPEHSQEVDDDGGSSLNGKSDYLTAIDYDGDWACNNNWNNLTPFPNSQFRAHVYYSVVWTKTHWYIIYAYYHPRDWSNSIFDPEHENDLEGILVIVRRPGANVIDLNDSVLEAGITVFHLDFYSYKTIGSSFSDDGQGSDGTLFTVGGTHPKTSQEAKGHGCKAWPNIGFDEDGKVTYKSNAANAAEFPITINDSDVKYKLVDIFEGGGLWDRRNNTETFALWGKFNGDDGGDNKANAPWTWQDTGGPFSGGDGVPEGFMALDPAFLTDEYFNSTFPISHCYQFLPYDCNYDIKASSLQACQNKTITYEIVRKNDLPVNNETVNWTYDPTHWECVSGCGTNDDKITLRAKVNITSFEVINAEVNTIECGTQSINAIVLPTSNCAVAAFHFEDSNGNSRNVFCPGEEIFMDGTASQNETAYYIDAWRRPIGSTANFSWYAGLGWSQGQVPTLNLTNEFAPTVFTPGFEYEIKLAVQSQNTGWMPVTHRFRVLESCCKKPLNVQYDCQTAKVTWSTLNFPLFQDPNQYLVRVIWNDPKCCHSATWPTATQWYTTNQYFYLPYIIDAKCYSIKVGADCGNGDINWSDLICSDCKKLVPEQGLSFKEITAEAQVKAEVFPNPATTSVTLALTGPEELNLSVDIYNLQGKLIKQIPAHQLPDGRFTKTLDFEASLPRGLYLVYFKTNHGTFQEKLLLQ